MTKNRRKSRVFSLCAALLALIWGDVAIAQTAKPPPDIADSPCDMNYYESLKSRAWLEAQREITQNQNLIFKPDSVLQYTCFDQFIGVLSSSAGGMFSDSPPPKGETMGNALQKLVGGAVSSYLNANFNHTMLGGRMPPINSGGGGGSYNCNIMNQVWMAAKCMNFVDKSHDGFFTFSNYAVPPDKRMLPQQCAGSQLWNAEIGKATIDKAKPGFETPWTEDTVKTFFKEMNECGTNTKSIETGLLDKDNKPEKFCVPPGCYYDGQSCKLSNSAS